MQKVVLTDNADEINALLEDGWDFSSSNFGESVDGTPRLHETRNGSILIMATLVKRWTAHTEPAIAFDRAVFFADLLITKVDHIDGIGHGIRYDGAINESRISIESGCNFGMDAGKTYRLTIERISVVE